MSYVNMSHPHGISMSHSYDSQVVIFDVVFYLIGGHSEFYVNSTGGYILLFNSNTIFRFKNCNNFQNQNIISWTQRGWSKWLPFCRQHFQFHFLEWKCLYFDSNFTKLSSRVSKSPSAMGLWLLININTPSSTKFKAGYWFHLVHLSICPSVDRIVFTLSSIILAGSSSWLYPIKQLRMMCRMLSCSCKISKF